MARGSLGRGLILFVGGLAAIAATSLARSQPQPTRVRQIPALVSSRHRCASLSGQAVRSGVVKGAERVFAGATLVGGATAGAKASEDLCRVRLRLHPTAGSDIHVEVWLPDSWNGEMYGFGGAGFDGGLSLGGAQLLNKVVAQGFAAVETDVGHKAGAPLKVWAYKQPERIIDFGYRGNHLAAVVAKQIITAYYGASAKHAYFLGCSNGGRDAIMEASRYPRDYDGVIAGSPARRFVEIVTELIWYSEAVHGPSGAPHLASKLSLLHDAVMKQCDRLDGVKDGILEDPLLCHFDPAVLECKAADTPTCLTNAEVRALHMIYGGPRLSNGRQVSGGPEPGSEGVPDNWTAWITTPEAGVIGQQFYRWVVYDDPSWKIQGFNIDRDYRVAQARLAPILDADNPDLRAFARAGGKLIIYQGWDDPIVPPTDTIKYYDAVRRRLGPEDAKQVRLFMVPGMMHCAGGPGATSFDMQPVIEKWVQRGVAPQEVIATKLGSGTPPMTHLLCVWPKTAHYNGSGSTKDAANFTCK